MLLINAAIPQDGGFRENMCVRFSHGVVCEVGTGLLLHEDEPVTDLAGDWLLPGFVDVHIHGCGGHDAMALLPGLADIYGPDRRGYFHRTDDHPCAGTAGS